MELTADRLRHGGLQDRVSLVRSMLEEVNANEEYDVALINISMHECRDIEKVTSNVHRALKPDGYFVISDFPFPDSMEGCRTVPGRLMSGIQFTEALKVTSYYPLGLMSSCLAGTVSAMWVPLSLLQSTP